MWSLRYRKTFLITNLTIITIIVIIIIIIIIITIIVIIIETFSYNPADHSFTA